MKAFNISLLTGLVLFLAACSDTKTEDTPDAGSSILILTDWSNRSETAEIPAAFNAVIGGQSYDGLNGERNSIEKINAGTYELYLYNQAEGLNVTGKTASVSVTDGLLEPMPGWFFTFSREVQVREESVSEVNAYMQQQVRQLNINIAVTGGGIGRVGSLEGKLTGIAGSINMVTGSETGNATVPTAFSVGDGKYTSSVRLLGIGTAGEQLLILNLTSDTGETETITSDLTEKLSAFNTGKSRPLTLNTELYIPAEGGFSGMISDWDVVEEGDITAE